MLHSKKKVAIILAVLLIFGASAPVSAAYDYKKASEEFADTLELIDALYYYSDTVDYKTLIDAALVSVFENLDPYSQYLTMDEYRIFHQYAESNKSGIGVSMRKNGSGQAVILKVFKDSPAEKAGFLQGDLLVKVADTDIFDKSLMEIRELIFGETGSNVAVTVLRNGNAIKMNVTRGRYTVPMAERVDISTLIEGADNTKTAYVEIVTFSHNDKNPENDTAAYFSKIYSELKNEGISNLIIDLRGNSGGDVLALIEMAEILVKQGVIFTIKYNTGETDTFRSSNASAPEFNVAVLVDTGTASSSEILASAIKESGSGIIIGSETFGKGVGQKPLPAFDGKHMILITMSEIITRNGNKLDGVGVVPDVLVKQPPWILEATEINPESSKENIASLRAALNYIGYNAGSGAGYDTQLKNAVESFQKNIGRPQDGVCDEYTIGRINDFVADKSFISDTALLKAYEVLNKR